MHPHRNRAVTWALLGALILLPLIPSGQATTAPAEAAHCLSSEVCTLNECLESDNLCSDLVCKKQGGCLGETSSVEGSSWIDGSCTGRISTKTTAVRVEGESSAIDIVGVVKIATTRVEGTAVSQKTSWSYSCDYEVRPYVVGKGGAFREVTLYRDGKVVEGGRCTYSGLPVVPAPGSPIQLDNECEISPKKGVGPFPAGGKALSGVADPDAEEEEDRMYPAAVEACLDGTIDLKMANKPQEPFSTVLKKLPEPLEEKIDDPDCETFGIHYEVDADTDKSLGMFGDGVGLILNV